MLYLITHDAYSFNGRNTAAADGKTGPIVREDRVPFLLAQYAAKGATNVQCRKATDAEIASRAAAVFNAIK